MADQAADDEARRLEKELRLAKEKAETLVNLILPGVTKH